MPKTEASEDKLTEQEARELYNAAIKHGARTVSEKLGCSPLSLASAIAGIDVTKGTIALIRTHKHKLGELK